MPKEPYLDDPEASVFWFNMWLSHIPADANTPIFEDLIDLWVKKELGKV